MKPFNLEKALAGEPVKLRNGCKAYVKYLIPEEFNVESYICGFAIDSDGYVDTYMKWRKGGVFYLNSSLDIVEMWEEPREQVTITIPAPLKNYPRNDEEYWVVDDMEIKNKIWENAHIDYIEFDTSFAFSTKEDAEAFLNSIQGARR